MATKLARLKPHDPRRRHLLRSYMHGPSGKRFEEKRGWYRVTDELARSLARVHQVETDPESPKAFDICTLEEAKAIDKKERVVLERRAGAADANDLTTSDLGENRVRAADLGARDGDEVGKRPVARKTSRVPKGQRNIRGGVRDPRERSTRPADDETA
jgi:hypothetical protein